MNKTSAINTPALVNPSEGEIWLSLETGEPIVVTGVLANEDSSALAVNFSTLDDQAFEASMGYFLEHYSRR